jgi:hypothetical protein
MSWMSGELQFMFQEERRFFTSVVLSNLFDPHRIYTPAVKSARV